MRSVKCVVVGDGAVGKTSLLISYTTNSFPFDYVPTVFDNYTTTISLNKPNDNTLMSSSNQRDGIGEVKNSPNMEPKLVKLNLWDTAGQEEYDKLRPLSYPQTDVFLICFAVNEVASFKNVENKWFPEIAQYTRSTIYDSNNYSPTASYSNSHKLPILLVGTKSDLRDATDDEDINEDKFVPVEQIKKLVESCGFAGYVECSAMTQVGVKDVFEKATRLIVDPSCKHTSSPSVSGKNMNASENNSKNVDSTQEQKKGKSNLTDSNNNNQVISNSNNTTANSHSHSSNVINKEKTKNEKSNSKQHQLSSSSKKKKKFKLKSNCIIL